MTLSLTIQSRSIVVQAADRLVSRSDTGDPWDRVANKTVLCSCADGAAVVTYSGAAIIGRRFTDEILASAPGSQDLSDATFSARIGPERRCDVGQTVLRMTGAIRRAASVLALPASQYPLLTIAGWKWHAVTESDRGIRLRGIQPFLWGAAYDPSQGRYHIHNGQDGPLPANSRGSAGRLDQQ